MQKLSSAFKTLLLGIMIVPINHADKLPGFDDQTKLGKFNPDLQLESRESWEANANQLKREGRRFSGWDKDANNARETINKRLDMHHKSSY